MYFIVEDIVKLKQIRLRSDGNAFVEVVPKSYLTHPKLSTPALLYIRIPDEKGYIVPIDHSEGAGMDIKDIQELLTTFDVIYTLSKKRFLYSFTHNNIIDVNMLRIFRGESPINNIIINLNIEFILRRNSNSLTHNNYVPISKWYENFEDIFNKIEFDIARGVSCSNTTWDLYNNKYIDVLYQIESQGITIDTNKYSTIYNIPTQERNVKDGKIYTYYNPYNQTGRPTNSFNGINFLSIPKDGTNRECFIPTNGYLVEMDYDSYHLRLIADLIDYDWGNQSIHETLGKIYFNTDELTEDQYQESKQITFKNIYGSAVSSNVSDIEFFKKKEEYIDRLWYEAVMNGQVRAPGSEKVFKLDNNITTKHKLFNYIIQNYETTININVIYELISYLKEHNSRVILYTYDAVLIDWMDDESVLQGAVEIMEQNGYPVRIKKGDNYGKLNS